MYITIDELKTHARMEEISDIIRDDETIAHACIDMAIELASSKLMKTYDVKAIFDAREAKRSALLVKIIKDIAIFEIINLANPHIDYADKKYRHEQAIDWLNAVYNGMPANLPRLPEQPENKKSSFTYHSNPKRNNHF